MPAGKQGKDGFRTRITFELNTNVELWQIEVTPPSLSAGGAIDLVSMESVRVRQQSPKQLISIGPTTLRCGYDPKVYASMLNMLGKNQLITATYPDGRATTHYGWVDEFKPDGRVEGNRPTAMVTVIASMSDNSDAETIMTVGTTSTTATTTTTTVV